MKFLVSFILNWLDTACEQPCQIVKLSIELLTIECLNTDQSGRVTDFSIFSNDSSQNLDLSIQNMNYNVLSTEFLIDLRIERLYLTYNFRL
jgi:hypothetical protein